MNLDIVKKRIEILNKAREELKTERMIREEELQNSEKYRQIKDKIRDCQIELKTLIHKNLIAAGYARKIQEMNEEIRDLKHILDYELLNYNKETEEDQIEDSLGNLFKITFKSTIKPTRKTNQQRFNFKGK